MQDIKQDCSYNPVMLVAKTFSFSKTNLSAAYNMTDNQSSEHSHLEISLCALPSPPEQKRILLSFGLDFRKEMHTSLGFRKEMCT